MGLSLLSSANLAALIPSVCGIEVYRDETYAVHSRLPGGTGLTSLILRRKSVVSVMYDSVFIARGLRWWSTNSDIFSVQLSI